MDRGGHVIEHREEGERPGWFLPAVSSLERRGFSQLVVGPAAGEAAPIIPAVAVSAVHGDAPGALLPRWLHGHDLWVWLQSAR